MATTKFEVNIYNRRGDFNMWSQKNKGHLMQMKCAKALDNSWPAEISVAKRTELEEIA